MLDEVTKKASHIMYIGDKENSNTDKCACVYKKKFDF